MLHVGRRAALQNWKTRTRPVSRFAGKWKCEKYLTTTDGRELGVEAGRQATPLGGTYKEMSFVAKILDPRAHGEGLRNQRRIWRLLGLAASRRP